MSKSLTLSLNQCNLAVQNLKKYYTRTVPSVTAKLGTTFNVFDMTVDRDEGYSKSVLNSRDIRSDRAIIWL